jgi:hypothetical protein
LAFGIVSTAPLPTVSSDVGKTVVTSFTSEDAAGRRHVGALLGRRRQLDRDEDRDDQHRDADRGAGRDHALAALLGSS